MTDGNFTACYAKGELHLNVDALGRAWFHPENREKQVELLLHEFAHFYEGDHLSANFADSVGRLGAKLAAHLGLDNI